MLVTQVDTPDELRAELIVLFTAEAAREAGIVNRATTKKAARYAEGQRDAYRDVVHMLRTMRIEAKP